MRVVRVGPLPDSALAAAAEFYAQLDDLSHPAEDITLVFPPADYTHRAWRLAAVQELARAHAPLRVNAVASDDENAIAAAQSYLASASAITGQYLPLDSTCAGKVV